MHRSRFRHPSLRWTNRATVDWASKAIPNLNAGNRAANRLAAGSTARFIFVARSMLVTRAMFRCPFDDGYAGNANVMLNVTNRPLGKSIDANEMDLFSLR